jgi:GTPase SAR1 family protein
LLYYLGYIYIFYSHFKGAGGAIVVYDITKEKTFENLHKWIEDLKE